MAAASIFDESLAQGNAGPAGLFWTEAVKTGLDDITVEQSNLILRSIAARLSDNAKNCVPAEERGQYAHFELTYGKVDRIQIRARHKHTSQRRQNRRRLLRLSEPPV